MIIAPAFYLSQIDLAGPFKAYSTHPKRKKSKLGCCFRLRTISATKIKVMDEYGSLPLSKLSLSSVMKLVIRNIS